MLLHTVYNDLERPRLERRETLTIRRAVTETRLTSLDAVLLGTAAPAWDRTGRRKL